MPTGSPKECTCSELILLVTSDMHYSKLLKKLLKRQFGLALETADTGIEASEKFVANRAKVCCQSKYRLVIIDLNLQNDGGFNAAKHMLEH